jgi:cytochrome c peroxidase
LSEGHERDEPVNLPDDVLARAPVYDPFRYVEDQNMKRTPERSLSLRKTRTGNPMNFPIIRSQDRHERARHAAEPISELRRSGVGAMVGAGLLAMSLTSGMAQAEEREDTPQAPSLRQYINDQVGGLDKLKVPPDNASIPVPPDDPARPGRYKTTEAKRFLGKMLFHDPVRSARIGSDTNTGQPLPLPAGTAFGGTVSGSYSDPNIQAIVNAQRQDTSCGSCHIGEAAGKAGQVVNFASGGEGRGYTDGNGNFFPRRRPQSILTKLRSGPIFAGDALVDALPTLTDIFVDANGQRVVTTPALFYHSPQPTALLATGRLDELDSVARQSMSMIGFAFNNRLLFGGLGGELQSTAGSLNPLSDPAQENLTLLLLDAHRMLNFQSAELLKIPSFVKLFRDAFPEEAAQADAMHDLTLLVNDQTEFRAQATFLRTVVTRNTPFDDFLAGNDGALTPAQQRGAALFFTPAAGGAGGAGCFSCHSGPMLNKQHDDPDVAGIGAFVGENFFNIGIGDHPVQALNALARGHLDPTNLGKDGFPYHAEDTGRQEVTHDPADAFKFRALTLRQLKDARTFFHNGSFTKVRDVVEYFNAGVPQDPTAGGAPTLSARFTTPRGTGFPRGLGLSEQQVDDLADFLENALYDPAFVHFDPTSSTDTLQPNQRDLAYSVYRPDLAALGARDGFMPSGLAIDDNDPLSRRDQGLEFLDVTAQVNIALVSSASIRNSQGELLRKDVYRITNSSSSVVDTQLLTLVSGLSSQIRLENASGIASTGDPYLRTFLPDGVLLPGQSLVQVLGFRAMPQASTLSYRLTLLSGQGNP